MYFNWLNHFDNSYLNASVWTYLQGGPITAQWNSLRDISAKRWPKSVNFDTLLCATFLNSYVENYANMRFKSNKWHLFHTFWRDAMSSSKRHHSFCQHCRECKNRVVIVQRVSTGSLTVCYLIFVQDATASATRGPCSRTVRRHILSRTCTMTYPRRDWASSPGFIQDFTCENEGCS